jgi:site-specific DNA-adenine methylase
MSEIEKRRRAIWGSPAGKSAIADKIAAMLPPHRVYVEPFVGSGAVLFAKEKSEVEVINDADEEIADAFKIIKELTEEKLKALERKNWKNSRATFERLRRATGGDDVERLHRFLCLARFSYGGMRRGGGFNTSREAHVYSRAVATLRREMGRVKNVKVYDGDYEKVVRKYDGPDTVFFFDPPYSGHDARVRESKFDEAHFFDVLKSLKGKWLLTYGARGELPGMLKKAGFNLKRFKTFRSLSTMVGGTGDKALSQFWTANYEIKNAAKLAKTEHRALRVSDPEHLVSRLTDGQPAGILSSAPRDGLVDEEILLVDDVKKDDEPRQAFGVVVLKSGVRFTSGAVAVQKLGDKLDQMMADTHRDDDDPVWFIPLRLKERWDPPRVISKGEREGAQAPAPKAYDDRNDFLKDLGQGDALKSGVVVEPMLVGKRVVIGRNSEGRPFVTFDGKKDQSSEFPGIAKAASQISAECMLVGVWVPLDDHGNPKPVDKAVWSTAYINDLPDSAFLYIEAGGEKDDEGKTKPRTLRHFPVRDADGKLDPPHVRNAIARAPQAKLPAEVIERVQAEARKLLDEVNKASPDPRGSVFVFDALLWKGEDLTRRPWTERKAARDQALGERGVGALVNSPCRVVHSRNALADAIPWAEKHPASEGVVGKLADGLYTPAGRFATLKTTRTVNALVTKCTTGDGGTVYGCAIGPIDSAEAKSWKGVIDIDGQPFVHIGDTAPSKIRASRGDVLRVAVDELLVIDSHTERAITWGTPIVNERVHVRPDSISSVRSKASANEIIRKTEVAVLKSDDDERYVLGVVLEPNDGSDGAPLDPDAHRDVYSVEEVRKAAHRYLIDYNRLGVMHKRVVKKAEMVVCESWVSPVDFEFEGQRIRKGAWLLGAYVLSDNLWAQVKSGKLNAWSIQGKAMSKPEVVKP